MTYRPIETWQVQTAAPVQIAGRTFDVPSLVEDESGARLLLVPDLTIPAALWVWAHQSGAAALICPSRGLYILSSRWEEDRVENARTLTYSAPEEFWWRYRDGADYLELINPWDLDPPAEAPSEPERLSGRFVHLHAHTEFSQTDGLQTVREYVGAVVADGQPAAAITDHGNCAGHPDHQLECDKAGIKPIFGMEAYFVPDRREHTDLGYWHLVLLAENDIGLKNIWAMSTASWEEDGFYGKPRVDWELLERHAEGVIVTSACMHGPVLHPFLRDDFDLAFSNMARLKSIFGDRFFLELHTNQLEEQVRSNLWLLDVATAYDVPLIAVVDAHYSHPEHQHAHKVWVGMSIGKDFADASNTMFQGNQEYHVKTAVEVEKALAYLDKEQAGVVAEAMANTVRVAERCTARIVMEDHKPVFSKATPEHPDPKAWDIERLFDLCMENWEERTVGKTHSQDVYMARFEHEFGMIVRKEFPGYFLTVADLVAWAKDNGAFVGPGRGSGGGSLVAYVTRITEIDPVENNLLFERFMTEGRTELPDFDIDIPSSWKLRMFERIQERWGAEYVAIVGTHMRLKSKGVVNSVSRALKSTLPEDYYAVVNAFSKFVKDAEAGSAGIGVSWEDLWIEHGEVLAPMREALPEVFELADLFYGRLNAYGKHPAGVIISQSRPILGELPLRRGDPGSPMVAQFDLKALEKMGFSKFDFLNLRTLDTLQAALDLIKERTGRLIDVYGWKRQYEDPQVYDEIGEGWTDGMFQIETDGGKRMMRRLQPQSVAELADGITLVRPGPTRAGLTDTYFRRRNGEEAVTVPDPRLEPVLIKTLGCMLYQEDIMQTAMVLAGYGSDEADTVRKVLGKKQVEKVAAEGQKFISRAVENGTDERVAQLLWEQMAEFAKYSFNRAHAFAYAILGFWTGWFKVHYPVEMLTALLSTVDKDEIPTFVEEARRMGYAVQPPDLNESGRGFTAGAVSVRYGLMSVKGIGEAAADSIIVPRAQGLYTSWEDFLARKGGGCNAGAVKTLVHVGAADSLIPGGNRRGLEAQMEVDAIKGSDRCRWKAEERVVIGLPLKKPNKQALLLDGLMGVPPMEDTENTRVLPCSYDWANEPRIPSRKEGKFQPNKPLPAKCSKACRRYDPVELPSIESVEPYTAEDIRNIELDILGVYLSSTPFDRMNPEDLESCSTAVDVLSGPEAKYMVAGLIAGVRRTTDRNGRGMAFLALNTPRGSLSVTVFGDQAERYATSLVPKRLGFFLIEKNARGQNLVDLVDLG